MDIPWGMAAQIGGVGFGTVFALLILLAIIIWLTGRLLNKPRAGKSDAASQKKGD